MTQKGSANMENLFEPKQVFTNIPELLNYLPTTLELTLISFLISLAVGLLLGVIKMKKIPVLTQLANLFISIIRGTPVLVQLYVTYFGIPMFLKVHQLPLWDELQREQRSGDRLCLCRPGTQLRRLYGGDHPVRV